MENNNFNGFGRYFYSSTGVSYIGWWKDSRKHGNGQRMTKGKIS